MTILGVKQFGLSKLLCGSIQRVGITRMKKMADLFTKSAILVLVAKAPIYTGLFNN